MFAGESEAFLFSRLRHVAAITPGRGAWMRMIVPGLLGCVVSMPDLAMGSTGGDVVRLERRALAMGTRVEVTVEAAERTVAVAASQAALDAIADAERRLSTWVTGSEIGRLNSATVGSWVGLSPVTAHELSDALRWAEATGGAFDPTVGVLVRAWDLRGAGRVPGETELTALRERVGWTGLEVGAARGRRTIGGLEVEEGGFGKGAALRAATAAAVTAAARCVRVDLGGQWASAGACGEVVLSIAHPSDRSRVVATLEWARGSVATSGHSERDVKAEGVTIGHLLDPRTGRPAPDRGSVTVLADDPLTADAVATALAVMGPQDGSRWLSGGAGPGVEAVFAVAPPVGAVRLTATEGLGPRIRPADGVTLEIVATASGSGRTASALGPKVAR